ncbi:von Willebrand factor type A domain protein [Dictyocaulus viviparus]|uniref:von Willebrand factor type A domain protein n=1 Tax=Dictyocaulus viviparus TaxID=29172 RepID=A0A0D8XWM3_DICVI|nr:von Willebrand factor type A domain protein [Dictyocaulus viviparus]
MDIIFAIMTRNMTKIVFDNLLNAVSQFADYVDLSPDVTRIGLIYGSKDIAVPLPLGGYQEKEHMRDTIRNIEFSKQFLGEEINVEGPAEQQFIIFPRSASFKLVVVFAEELSSLPEDSDEITYVFVSPSKSSDRRATMSDLSQINGKHISKMIKEYCQQTEVFSSQKANDNSNYITNIFEKTHEEKLPTDESGNVIYPVTKPDGSPLPTDTSGNFVTDEGTIIEKDEDGRPLGPDGQVLPTDQSGNYIYPAIGPDGSPLPTDMHKRPVYPVFGEDGRPLPRDRSGAYIDTDGRPIPTDRSGKPLGDNGLPLPTDASGNYVMSPYAGKELPTDESGNVIYPVIKPDQTPLQADRFRNLSLLVDKTEDTVYPVVEPDGGSILEGVPSPSAGKGLPIGYVVVTVDRRPLPTNAYGSVIDEEGHPLPTDDIGRPLDHTLRPLSTNRYGEYVLLPRRRQSRHCVVSSHIELIVVLDTSNSIKVLDYRIMKELLKNFLIDHFDLTKNKVRIGVVKYGESAEVPISLGDYDHIDELLHRISETRRVKGKSMLGLALKEVAGEFLISGTEGVPKFMLLLKNGASATTNIISDRNEIKENLMKH